MYLPNHLHSSFYFHITSFYKHSVLYLIVYMASQWFDFCNDDEATYTYTPNTTNHSTSLQTRAELYDPSFCVYVYKDVKRMFSDFDAVVYIFPKKRKNWSYCLCLMYKENFMNLVSLINSRFSVHDDSRDRSMNIVLYVGITRYANK